jgi:ferric-dicitrate binding protein FerR (iron transport regulator)
MTPEIKTADDARQAAIDWQNKQSGQALSYAELAEKQAWFEQLAEHFNLTDEFKENGII